MDVIENILLVVGLVAIVVGVVLVSVPMALIVGGAEAVALSWLLSLRPQRGDR